MGNGAENASCARCGCANICKYKEQYLEILSKCNAFLQEKVDDYSDFLSSATAIVQCKHYTWKE